MRAQAYIMSAGTFIKVGMARNLEKRMEALSTGCPYPLSVIWKSGWMSKNDARHLEICIQDRLTPHHVRGEWFKISHPAAINTAEEMKKALS